MLLKQVRRYKTRQSPPPNNHPATHETVVTPSIYFRTQYFLNYILAAILLVPCLPLMAIFMCLVKLTSRGPAIYSQCRLGQQGQKFQMYKIRSMRHDAESHTGPAWTQTADPRVTLLGRFMRKFHIDEMPQLFNVLRGEMSLVGPRPERPEFVEVLSRRIPDYSKRLLVKPGITGMAQLNLPPDSDLDSVRRKVILDIEYIQNANIWLDLKLILCTGFRFTKLPILGIFGIHRTVSLHEDDVEKTYSRPDAETVVSLKQFQMQLESNAKNGTGARLKSKKCLDPANRKKKALK
jgi:lipopolysaccharide/colanic/teichoic acid biosynthesis glycosyltransferase